MCIKKSQEPPKYALPTNDTRHIFPIKDGPVTKETCHCQKWQGVWTQFPYVILWHNGVKVSQNDNNVKRNEDSTTVILK